MENHIIKFKNDLKSCQIIRKKLIPMLEREKMLFDIIIKRFEREMTAQKGLKLNLSLPEGLELNEINAYLTHISVCYPIDDTIKAILFGKKKTQINKLNELKQVYAIFCSSINATIEEHKTTQKMINAFENDKIKDPINDIRELFLQIKYNKTMTIAEISQIIGMAVSFNSQYAAKNKNHNIQHLDLINILTQYYNPDGTLKYNEDIETFINTMKTLTAVDHHKYELFNQLFNFTGLFTIQALTEFLIYNNFRLQNNNTSSTENTKEQIKEDYSIAPETREALEELKKYYKNGTIIEIPKNLDEFNRLLETCSLDEKEKTYIINLINQKLAELKSTIIQKYLNEEEQSIYVNAINLLNSFNYSNGDSYILKQYIEELQTILEMLEAETNEDNQNYLLEEIRTIISELSEICNKYTKEDTQSTNKFIFLLNKDNIPYICDDKDTLDSPYKKAINSLISKIDKANQSQFRKILNNEQLEYNMYEVCSHRGHVAFVEINSGIYVIIGANIPRNGYRELQNRLKANQELIQQLENIVKNPETRNQILTAHEEFLPLFTEPNNDKDINNHKRKRTPNN